MTEFIIEIDEELYSPSEWRELTGCMERIVRCRDCGYYRSVREGGMVFCTKHSYIAEPDGYCAWSTPKEGKNDA